MFKVSKEQRKLDKERGEQYNERWCQDCYDEIPDNQRRRRCNNCGKLVCEWCMNHVHGLYDQTPRDILGMECVKK